ncbi:MAG: hypothetical protein WAS21_27955 [Geminicoccaceae bacterium]
MATHLRLVQPGGPDDDTPLVDLSALPADTLWRLECSPYGGYTLGLLHERDGWVDGGSHDRAQPAIDAAAEAWRTHQRIYAAFRITSHVPAASPPKTPLRLGRIWADTVIFLASLALCKLVVDRWLS